MIFIIFLYIEEPFNWVYYTDLRYINSISCGQRYVYIAGDGIMLFDKLSEEFITLPSRKILPKNIKLVYNIGDIVYFCTNDSFYEYNSTYADYNGLRLPTNFGSPCSIAYSNAVYLWDGKNCIKFDGKNFTFTNFNKNLDWKPTHSIYEYSWLAPFFVMDDKLNKYNMTCCEKDFDKLWVGTNGYGVYKYDIYNYLSEHYIIGLPQKKLYPVFTNKENFFICVYNEIIKFTKNGMRHKCSEYLKITFPLEYTAIYFHNDTIWIGTTSGLYYFTDNILHNTTIDNKVTCLYYFDKLYVGTDKGVKRFVNNRVEIFIDGGYINDIKFSKDGKEVWVATPYGIFVNGKEFTDPYGILVYGVNKIDFFDKIYFSTTQGLLVYDEKKNEWQRFISPVHLPSNNVYCVAGDEAFGFETIWVGTSSGVAKYDKKHNLFKIYDKNNSPITGAVYSIYVDENFVYFFCENGLVKYKK